MRYFFYVHSPDKNFITFFLLLFLSKHFFCLLFLSYVSVWHMNCSEVWIITSILHKINTRNCFMSLLVVHSLYLHESKLFLIFVFYFPLILFNSIQLNSFLLLFISFLSFFSLFFSCFFQAQYGLLLSFLAELLRDIHCCWITSEERKILESKI